MAKEADLLGKNVLKTALVATLALVGFSLTAIAYPSISHDFVFVIDKSEILESQLDWMLEAHADVIENEIAPLADGPGQINIAIVTYRQHTRTVLGLTDAYTDLDAILEAIGPRFIDRNTDSGVNTSDAIDVAREILDGGSGFRQMIILSTRFFPNTWNNNDRPVPCAEGFEGICARVAMRQACEDAIRDGYELWPVEIDHYSEGFRPGLSDFPYMMRECAGRSERAGEAGSRSEFISYIDNILEEGRMACVNVGFERDLDRNINDRVDNDEFFEAMDFWVNDCMPDSVFFNILDLWVSQGRISVITAADDNQLNAVLTSQSLNITAQGASAVEINIYGLSGQEIHSQSANGSKLSWNLRTDSGQPLANGVYIAQVTSRNSQGDVIGSEIKKIAVLR